MSASPNDKVTIYNQETFCQKICTPKKKNDHVEATIVPFEPITNDVNGTVLRMICTVKPGS